MFISLLGELCFQQENVQVFLFKEFVLNQHVSKSFFKGLRVTVCALGLSLAASFPLSAKEIKSVPSSVSVAQKIILVVGDSLSAAYGLRKEDGWVSLLEARIKAQGLHAQVINASVSGETTSGGKSRLGALLAQHKPTHVVIELGANDALRGQALLAAQKNLVDMSEASKKSGARVLILGMQIPPNYGSQYAASFGSMFPLVASSTGASLVPFMLAGVADAANPASMFLSDGLHPNAKAQPKIMDNVWSELFKMIK